MDLINELKAKAKKSYESDLKVIDKKAPQIRKCQVLEYKARIFFEGCITHAYYNETYSWSVPTVQLYLSGEYNITRDVNIFLDEHSEFITFISDGEEVVPILSDTHMSWCFPDVTLHVFFEGGACERVKVGEKSRTIKEPIYEVRCN